MYIIKSRYGKNIHIKDLGIRLIGTNQIGVKVDELDFERSADVRKLIDDLIVKSDGINKTGTKNIVYSVEELEALPDIFPGEIAILAQKDGDDNTTSASEFIWDDISESWIPLGGDGSGGGPGYIHPSTHPASMIKESDDQQFVSKAQKENWDKKVDKAYIDAAVNPKADKTYVDAELKKKADTSVLSTYALKSEIPNVSGKADKAYVDTELAKKANIVDVYNKTEIDKKLEGLGSGEGSGDGDTVTDSTINGNILVNGSEVVAYEHPAKHNVSEINGLHIVATSGSYNDLTDKPSIPAAYDDTALKNRVQTLENNLSQMQTTLEDVLKRLAALEPGPSEKFVFEFILPNSLAEYDLNKDENWKTTGKTLSLEDIYGSDMDGIGNKYELRWYGYPGNIMHPDGIVCARTGIESEKAINPDGFWAYDLGVLTFETGSPSPKVYKMVEV